jgi:hypothetical protein
MVTEYEALGTLMGTVLTLLRPGQVKSRAVARHEPVARNNSKTARISYQIHSSTIGNESCS